MNILMSGCDQDSVGRFMRTKLEEQGHGVVGFGLEGPEIQIDVCDMHTDLENVGAQIWREATEYFGAPIDCVFNHAGVTRLDWIEHHSVQDMLDLFKINCLMPYITSRELVRQIIWETDNGLRPLEAPRKIVNTCTIGTAISLRSSSGYIASKGALESLTKNMSKELAGRWPITVIGISPGGIIDTPMTETEKQGHMRTRDWTREQAEDYALTSNLGRKGTWEEVWAVVDFAINNAPEYMTGSIIKMPNGLGVA
jgi:3-oxoacyl-[acyl-carrier protein] reductase